MIHSDDFATPILCLAYLGVIMVGSMLAWYAPDDCIGAVAAAMVGGLVLALAVALGARVRRWPWLFLLAILALMAVGR